MEFKTHGHPLSLLSVGIPHDSEKQELRLCIRNSQAFVGIVFILRNLMWA